VLFAARKEIIDAEDRKFKQFLVAKSEIMKNRKLQIQTAFKKKLEIRKQVNEWAR